jgi:very-short-patch-repair endonuclease
MSLIGKVSLIEELFAAHVRSKNLPVPVREFVFHPGRRWRFDFAWPEFMVAVEIEGGQWTQGRHQRPQGFSSDCEKYNAATKDGWRVYRFPGDQVTNGQAIDFIMGVMGLLPKS